MHCVTLIKNKVIMSNEVKQNQTFSNILSLPKKFSNVCLILHQFPYLWRKMVTIEIVLLNFFGVKMSDKMATSAYILKTVEKDPISVFTNFFATNKQYVKIKD